MRGPVTAGEGTGGSRPVGPPRSPAAGDDDPGQAQRAAEHRQHPGPPRRPATRACLDWSERRHHLAGAAGAALLAALLERGRLVRRPGGRAVAVTRAGRAGLDAALGLDVVAVAPGRVRRLSGASVAVMRISVAADERTGVADEVVAELAARGHEVLVHGALSDAERDDWAWASEAAARDVAAGRADQGVVCCWTGTGASIAANKVAGVRAALCADAATAAGARRWNDANVLALSLRTTAHAELTEILDAWFAAGPSADPGDAANVAHLAAIERGAA